MWRGEPVRPPAPSQTQGTVDPIHTTFVTLHPTTDKKISTLNAFIIKKVLDYATTDSVESAKKLANGDLLVKTFNCVQVKQLLKLKTLHDVPVEASIPVNLNSCRGVVTSREFGDMTDAEIADAMKDQHVIAARRFTKLVNGERKNTMTCVLTFGVPKLPTQVYCGFEPAE